MLKSINKIIDKKLYWILFFLSPLSWRIVSNLAEILLEWGKIKHYFYLRMGMVFSEEKLVNTGLMRWAEIDDSFPLLYSKLLYNRLTILVGEFFDLLTFYSPRLFFQSGDGSIFSPQGVEPIPVILFPVFIYGLLMAIKEGKFKQISIYISLGVLPWLIGVKSFSYLFPLALVILYFIKIGFANMKWKGKYIYMRIVIFYGLYILGRVIWLS